MKDNAKRVKLGNSQKLDAQGGDQAGASVVDDTVEAIMAGIEDSGKPPEDKGGGENNREGKVMMKVETEVLKKRKLKRNLERKMEK